VPAERVLFLKAPDTQLTCSGETVGALQRLLASHGCNPALVFTHARSDSHGDHRAVRDLILSTFRKKPILCVGAGTESSQILSSCQRPLSQALHRKYLPGHAILQ
jgi:LmbE family N-acetylglucosaminyl deacetylase